MKNEESDGLEFSVLTQETRKHEELSSTFEQKWFLTFNSIPKYEHRKMTSL